MRLVHKPGSLQGGFCTFKDEKRVNELLQQKSGLKALLRRVSRVIALIVFLIRIYHGVILTLIILCGNCCCWGE